MATTSLRNWSGFEGLTLAERYEIQQWLGESENAAFFRANFLANGAQVVLELIPLETVDADRQLNLWSRIQQLSHPNLQALMDFDRCENAGNSFLYAVFEYPDEILATALESDSLSDAELLEAREAVSNGLRYIHSQGLVHGAVDAAHILAIGNQIKLESYTLRESSAGGPEQDVAQLDRVLPAPAPPPRPEDPTATATPPPTPAPARPSRKPPRSFPFWFYGALALVLGSLGFLFLPKNATLPPPRQTAPSQAQQPATSVVPSPPPQPAARERSAPSRDYWRVIAYTYSTRQAAQHRVNLIAQKWPDANAEVFEPNSGRSPYLVALGGRMNRDDALRMLKIGRGKGLPRDTYIQNYDR